MRKSLRVLGVLILIGLAWLLLVLSEWLPRPTQAQLDGLAALEANGGRAQGERNAFALFWLFGYDMPQAELEGVLEQDIARFQADAAAGRSLPDFPSAAAGRYPSLALWLREQDGDPAQAFARRPAALDSPAHAFALVDGRLRMQNLDTGRSAFTELPLAVPTPHSAD